MRVQEPSLALGVSKHREAHAPSAHRRRTVFFIKGAVLASWVPHIPAVQARHGDARLGLVLLAMAARAVVALLAAGRLVDRFGSRVMTSVAALAFCVAMPLPVLSPSLPRGGAGARGPGRM